jgi:hypothetical protein
MTDPVVCARHQQTSGEQRTQRALACFQVEKKTQLKTLDGEIRKTSSGLGNKKSEILSIFFVWQAKGKKLARN